MTVAAALADDADGLAGKVGVVKVGGVSQPQADC